MRLSMKKSSTDRVPAFWPQGLLIVLPLVILAGLGLGAIFKDRRTVEREARQRAHELAQQLATTLSRQVPVRFAEWNQLTLEWASFWSNSISGWPTSERAEYATQKFQLETQVSAWLDSGQAPEAFLFPPLLMSGDGSRVYPPRDVLAAPSPPEWFVQLSEEERRSWNEARSLESLAQPVEIITQAWRRFAAMTSSSEARAQAEFCIMRLSGGTGRVEALCEFARTNHGYRSAAGIPLSALATAAALALAETNELSGSLFAALRDQVFLSPSFVTSHLLDEAARRFGGSQPPIALHWLRRSWENYAALLHLADAMERSAAWANGARPLRPGSFWFDAPGGRWLAVVHADQSGSSENDQDDQKGSALVATNRAGLVTVQVVHQSVMRRLIERAMADTGLNIAPYFGLRLNFEGEEVGSRDSLTGRKPVLENRLASESGGNKETAASGSQAATARANDSADVWLGGFEVGVHLADPSLLFSEQRHRALWSSALIAAAALAAAMGLVQARRAFLRQLRLAELKSNFVSSVSHELRSPIASIRLMAEGLASERVKDPSKQRDYFHFIVQECRRLTTLIENVLDMARIEQHRKEYEFEPTDLVALVDQTVALLQPTASERRVTVTVVKPDAGRETERLGNFVMDGRAIQQALVNLVERASGRSCDRTRLRR